MKRYILLLVAANALSFGAVPKTKELNDNNNNNLIFEMDEEQEELCRSCGSTEQEIKSQEGNAVVVFKCGSGSEHRCACLTCVKGFEKARKEKGITGPIPCYQCNQPSNYTIENSSSQKSYPTRSFWEEKDEAAGCGKCFKTNGTIKKENSKKVTFLCPKKHTFCLPCFKEMNKTAQKKHTRLECPACDQPLQDGIAECCIICSEPYNDSDRMEVGVVCSSGHYLSQDNKPISKGLFKYQHAICLKCFPTARKASRNCPVCKAHILEFLVYKK